MPREVATEPPFLSHPPPLSNGNLHPAAPLRMRGNYFRPYLSIFACAIEVLHNNENSTTIIIMQKQRALITCTNNLFKPLNNRFRSKEQFSQCKVQSTAKKFKELPASVCIRHVYGMYMTWVLLCYFFLRWPTKVVPVRHRLLHRSHLWTGYFCDDFSIFSFFILQTSVLRAL